jgi:hypothetical protein
MDRKTIVKSPLLRLLPQPRRLRMAPGCCSMPFKMLRVHPAACAHLPFRVAAGDLGLTLHPDPYLPKWMATTGTAEALSTPPHAEGYALRITGSGATLAGHDNRGLVWALVTLAQIMRQASPPPCCDIEDWPEYAIRYHHDDISRRQVSTTADFLRIVRHLGAFKFSHYTMYMEDLFEIPGEPQFGCGRGALSAPDIRAIVAEGERRQIEVFPTVSLLGHQERMLRLPCYRALGARVWQPPSSFDPRNPAVREHVLKAINTLCPLFSSKWFHMGFDETQGLDAETFALHANWCAEQLVERGKTPLIWVDMLYNHYGIDLLDRLHPALVPVVWDYSLSGGVARASAAELHRHRASVWILGGYNTHHSFVHDPLPPLIEQWDNWRAAVPQARVGGFGASQWCDAADSLRDIVWLPAGAFAEHAWRGGNADPASVEERFDVVFYGHALPDLVSLRRLLQTGLALTAREAEGLHPLPATGWRRMARDGQLPSASRLAADAARLRWARVVLVSAMKVATTNRDHLRLYGVAIDCMASAVARAQAAHRPTEALCCAAVAALRRARASFRAVWLEHQKAEDLHDALTIWDEQIAGWGDLPISSVAPRKGWRPLNLGKAWNTFFPGVAGLPIGLVAIGDVPFRFAGISRTHGEVMPGQTLAISLPRVPMSDLHLVATQARCGDEPRPGACLRLSLGGRTVFEEELLNIRHLCDWWAPLGEHMWAGGGLAYVDPLRVRWLQRPNEYYGITCIARFSWSAPPTADCLELTCLAEKPVALFAVTLEEARR